MLRQIQELPASDVRRDHVIRLRRRETRRETRHHVLLWNERRYGARHHVLLQHGRYHGKRYALLRHGSVRTHRCGIRCCPWRLQSMIHVHDRLDKRATAVSTAGDVASSSTTAEAMTTPAVAIAPVSPWAHA